MGNVDDELHFLTSCTFLTEERNILYQCVSKYVRDLENLEETQIFQLILKCDNYHVIKALGLFIIKAFQKRRLNKSNIA